MYGYKALIETQLTYGYSAKKLHLKACRYYADTHGKFDKDLVGNKEWHARHNLINASKVADFETVIYSNFFQIYRYLPNNLDIRIKLIRNSDEFSLLCHSTATDDYKIKISDLSLSIQKIELH